MKRIGVRTVLLTDKEYCKVKEIAEGRNATNRAAGIIDQKVTSSSNEMTDEDGFGAEYATAIFLGVEPDFSLSPRSKGADLIYRQYRIDVKQTRWRHGKLLAKIGTPITNVHLYISTVGFGKKYIVRGWAWSRELLLRSRINYKMKKACHAMLENELRPFVRSSNGIFIFK